MLYPVTTTDVKLNNDTRTRHRCCNVGIFEFQQSFVPILRVNYRPPDKSV